MHAHAGRYFVARPYCNLVRFAPFFFCRAAGFCDLLLENTSKKSGKSVPISKSFTDLLESCPQIDGGLLMRILV